MASDTIWYWVDLSQLDQKEFERVYDLIYQWSFTGPREEKGYRQYTFTWNEPSSVESVTGLPTSVFRRLSGKQ